MPRALSQRRPRPSAPGWRNLNTERAASLDSVKLLARHEDLGPQEFWDLAEEAVDEVLQAHLAASPSRMRGIRHGGAGDSDPAFARQGARPPDGLFRQSDFRAGFARLAPLGLSFDAWVYHPQLPDVIDLAQSFPGTSIVLNHVGGPLGIGGYATRREAEFERWRNSVRQLSACPNVVVKLGGLGMRHCGFGFRDAGRAPDSTQLANAWRPYIETCIEAFGSATLPSGVVSVMPHAWMTRMSKRSLMGPLRRWR